MFSFNKPTVPSVTSSRAAHKDQESTQSADQDSGAGFRIPEQDSGAGFRIPDQNSGPHKFTQIISSETKIDMFSFKSPEVVKTNQTVGTVSTHYSFSPPIPVKSALVPRNMGGNFKSAAMPDVTYNFKTKTGDVLQGT